jgi:ABC-type polysaccharide/polyol phosphate transport system ATPase subunit
LISRLVRGGEATARLPGPGSGERAATARGALPAAPAENGHRPIPADRPAIAVHDLHKTFKAHHEPYTRVKDVLLHPTRAAPAEVRPSLDGVSFDVAEGEFFGIVGRNGSGKSTLLRCLSRIYRPDSGRIAVNGRIAPFIELGVGFNEDMSARENALINAIMFGLAPREARRRLAAIFEFAELEEFSEVKLKNYSSGMVVRLAFAVTVQVDADVLLFDEVLAVGDARFQRKCIEHFQRLKDEGRTVVLVTHDMKSVERFCDRALLLEGGRVDLLGEPDVVARRYFELNAPRSAGRDASPRERAAVGATIIDAWFEDARGRRKEVLGQGDACAACLEVAVAEPVLDPVFELSVRDADGRVVFRTSSEWGCGPTGRLEPGSQAVVRVAFDNWLAAGYYALSATVLSRAGDRLDKCDDLTGMITFASRETGAVADLPHRMEVKHR